MFTGEQHRLLQLLFVMATEASDIRKKALLVKIKVTAVLTVMISKYCQYVKATL